MSSVSSTVLHDTSGNRNAYYQIDVLSLPASAGNCQVKATYGPISNPNRTKDYGVMGRAEALSYAAELKRKKERKGYYVVSYTGADLDRLQPAPGVPSSNQRGGVHQPPSLKPLTIGVGSLGLEPAVF
ncbi:MAG: hypothetical protein A2580_17950 [Hydrogenophilales bacterium RIFOXYD1_FULL_62_11]|nr:MAG: hypothetical protein A2580_17950 [Hydrogenophilales bacterium RIFOXYD1_FULL_62_11]